MAAELISGSRPVSGPRPDRAASQVAGAVSVARARNIERDERRISAIPRPVAAISGLTAVYDHRGIYPSLRNFQIARPLPVLKPFEKIGSKISGNAAGILLRNYHRVSVEDRHMESGINRLV